MFSRISALTQKKALRSSKYQLLLKLTAPVQRVPQRQFTTEKGGDKDAVQAAPEVEKKEPTKESSQEDYNLDEVVTQPGDPQSAASDPAKSIDRRQRFQKKDGLFGKPRPDAAQMQQRRQQEQDAEDKPMTFEEFKQTKSYQIQQDIFNLIKNKIGTNDKQKVQRFYSKLQEQLRTQGQTAQMLDDVTISKIQALILEQKQLDDKSLYDQAFTDETLPLKYPGDIFNLEKRLSDPEPYSYQALRYDAGDTQKIPPMSKLQYEDFLEDQQEQLLKEFDLNNDQPRLMSGASGSKEEDALPEEAEGEEGGTAGSLAEAENREDMEAYNEFIGAIRHNIVNETLATGEERTVFDFDRVSQDVHSLKEKLEQEDQERRKQLRQFYEEDDINAVQESQLDRIFAQQKSEKEDEQEFEEMWQGLTVDLYSNLRDDLKNQYDQARLLMKFNQQLRLKILYQVRQNKQTLAQTLRQRDKLVQRLEIHARDFQSDVIPNKVFDFIGHQNQIHAASKLGKKKLAKQYLERKFDHQTSAIEAYNHELNLLINHYKIVDDSKLKREFIEKMGYVIELIGKNKAQKNNHTNARLFEYGVISGNNDFANQNLKHLVSGSDRPAYSLIDSGLLNAFYHGSLKSNNFAGLGHLLTYLEQYQVNIANWSLSSFKTPLEFNLNEKPNINNVLIFTKYYTYYHQCRERQELKNVSDLSTLSESEKFELHHKLFNQPTLVDLRALFGYLVHTLGTKQAIDPISKEDALWRIVEFFSRPAIREISQFGANGYNTISEQDVAQYLANRLNDSRVFEKITQTLKRNQDSQILHNSIMQSLKEYTAGGEEMPISFEPSKVRGAYIRMKTANEYKQVKMSEKNLEYFLYLFKSLQMWPEIIDACENYEKLTGSKSSEIRNYYLSDSLLSMPASEHYYEMIKKAVYKGQEQSDAGYITAITKAHLKDGAVDHAMRFFESEVAKLRDLKKKREDVLIALFDTAYGEVNAADSKLSFEDYKTRYLDAISLSTNLLRESYAVNRLSSVIKDKDFNQIETLFQLALVQKQENAILETLPSHLIASGDISDEALSLLPADQIDQLAQLKERGNAIRSKLDEQDAKELSDVLALMKQSKIQIFDSADDRSAEDIHKLFNLKSKEEVEAILKRTERFAGALLTDNLDEHSSLIDQWHLKTQQAKQRALKQNMEAINSFREYPDRGITNALDQTYKRKKIRPIDVYEDFDNELNLYNDYMLHDNIDDEGDPIVIMGEAHNQTLADMKEELLKALNARKGKVLTSALKIFNKVQDQQLKVFKLSTVENLSESSSTIDPKSVNDSLQKFNVLYNNPRSPIFSAVQTLAQYKGDKGMTQFSKLYRDLEDFFDNKIDIKTLQREKEQLENLNNELQRNQTTLKSLQSYLIKEQQDINKEVTAPDSSYTSWKNGKDRTLGQTLEKTLKKSYENFISAAAKGQSPLEFSRDEKLSMMRDIFSLEFGESKFASSQSVFPSFYAQDLIVFGLEHDSVEAVRLGEKMMSDNGYTLSIDIQKAVKEYLLNNAERYQKAIKKTGPIDNTSLYRRVTQKRGEDESAPVFYNVDDPYWNDFIAKNCARTQQWKLPSQYSWAHKQHGIFGEVVDMKRIRENQAAFRKYF